MRQQARTKQHIVKYKGYTLVQIPWTSLEREKQYAKYIINEEGINEFHAGYSKYHSHKQLRLYLRSYVDVLRPLLMKKSEEKENE